MPQVPRVTGPEVTLQAAPNAMLSASGADAAAFGGINARQVAAAAVDAQRASDKNDLDAIFRAETALKTDYLQFERSELARQGANADGAAERTKGWWEEQGAKYADGLTGRQRAIFEQRAASVRLAGTDTLMRHAETQKNKSLVDSALATAQTSADIAVGTPTPEAIHNAKTVIDSSTRSVAQVLGQTEEQRAAAALALTSKMHMGVIDTLAEKDTDAAKAHYYANKKEIAGADYVRIEKFLDTAGMAQKAQTEGARIAAKYGPDQTSEAQKEIDGLDLPAQQKAAVRAEVEHRHQIMQADQDRLNAVNTGKIMAAYSQGASLAQLKRMPEFATLRDGGAAIIEHVTDRSRVLAARNEEDAARAQRALTLKGFAASAIYEDPNVLTTMTRDQIVALLPSIGNENTQRLLNRYDSLSKSQDKVLAASIDQADFNSVADSLGLRPFDPTKSEAQRGALNEVKVRVDSLINDWQVANKKQMPAEEKRKLMANELSTMVEVQGRFFGSDQVSVLGVKKDQLPRVVVPPEDAQAILARYKAVRGQAYQPTAEEIATAYLKKKQRDAAGIK